MAVLRQVNRTKIKPELIGEVMKMHANLPPEDRGIFELRVLAITQLLADKGFKGRRHADMALAIEFRLTALARLLQEQEVRGWTRPGEERGQEYLNAVLIRAAATEPLIKSADDQLCFDPKSFRKCILRLAKPKGRA